MLFSSSPSTTTNEMSTKNQHTSSKLNMRQNFSENDMTRFVEEDAITEMGQVSLLSASSFSLKQRQPIYLDKKTSIYVTSQLDLNEADELNAGGDRTAAAADEVKKKMSKMEMIRHMRGFIYVIIYAIFFSLSGKKSS